MRKHKADFWLVLLPLLLAIVGLISIYAIGPNRAFFLNAVNGSEIGRNFFFGRQLLFVVVSVVVFVFAAKFPLSLWKKIGKWVLILAFVLCLILMIAGMVGAGIANCSNGACRWFRLPFGLGLQPAEILKFGLLLYIPVFLAEKKKEGRINSRQALIPLAVIAALATFFIIIAQKDMGTGVTMLVMLSAIWMLSGVKWRIMLITFALLIVAGVGMIAMAPHRMARITTFFEGSSGGEHIDNALLAVGVGGVFGVGVGNSVQATGYLPESINDSIFAIMGETFGFVGLFGIVMCFVILLMRLLRISELSDNPTNQMMAVGIFGWIASHFVINIMAMIGIIPLTGITLPLLSYGGTSMMIIAAVLGLALQLSMYTLREKKVRKEKHGKEKKK